MEPTFTRTDRALFDFVDRSEASGDGFKLEMHSFQNSVYSQQDMSLLSAWISIR